MLAIRLPRNGNGKIDLFQIGRGEVEGEVFTLEPMRNDGQITGFRLVPCAKGQADMIQEVFDGISAELKDSMPFHPSKEGDNNEEPDMKYAKMAFDSFNAMNRMGKQMINNMMGRIGQANQAPHAVPCWGMPDPRKIMDSFQKMDQTACGAMSDQNPMGQAVKYMAKMNLNFLSMLRQMNEQQQKMMNLFFDSVQKMNENLSEEHG